MIAGYFYIFLKAKSILHFAFSDNNVFGYDFSFGQRLEIELNGLNFQLYPLTCYPQNIPKWVISQFFMLKQITTTCKKNMIQNSQWCIFTAVWEYEKYDLVHCHKSGSRTLGTLKVWFQTQGNNIILVYFCYPAFLTPDAFSKICNFEKPKTFTTTEIYLNFPYLLPCSHRYSANL